MTIFDNNNYMRDARNTVTCNCPGTTHISEKVNGIVSSMCTLPYMKFSIGLDKQQKSA